MDGPVRKPQIIPPLFQRPAPAPAPPPAPGKQHPHPACQSTSAIAGQQAARNVGSWRKRILDRLRAAGPQTLFEISSFFEVPDHTISGRFSELERDGYIEKGGERRPHPVSGCPAEVWRLRGVEQDRADWAIIQGLPISILIDGEPYDRQELLPDEGQGGWPGIPYARRTDTGALRQAIRVELVECPGCGKPLKFVPSISPDGKPIKQFRCGTPNCSRTWEAAIVQEPGQPKILAMIMRTF